MNSPEVLQEVSSADVAREFLMGELISAATRQLRASDVAWMKIPENGQRMMLDEVRRDIERAVREAVEIIASDSRTRFRAHVESVTFKDGVKAVLQMGNTAASHELADTAGASVLVVIEDPARYTIVGENAPKTEPDQQRIDA